MAYIVVRHELATEHNEPVRHCNLYTLLQQGTKVSLLRGELIHKRWECIEVEQHAAEREVGKVERKCSKAVLL